jgi:hypothetical protein
VGDARAVADTLPAPTEPVRGLKAHEAAGPLLLRPEGRRRHSWPDLLEWEPAIRPWNESRHVEVMPQG